LTGELFTSISERVNDHLVIYLFASGQTEVNFNIVFSGPNFKKSDPVSQVSLGRLLPSRKKI